MAFQEEPRLGNLFHSLKFAAIFPRSSEVELPSTWQYYPQDSSNWWHSSCISLPWVARNNARLYFTKHSFAPRRALNPIIYT
jgi:hypothetical protein